MKSTIKKLPKSQIEIEIEVSPEELDNFVEKATLNLGRNLEVDGFRKGMAPKEIIKEKVGKENILIEAADLTIKENYQKVVLEKKIEAISQPEIDILKLAQGNPFVFKAKISVLPELKLPDYKKIASQIKKNKVFVEEKEIEDALKWLRKSRAKFTLKNEPAQKGDFVEIEYWLSRVEDLSQPTGQKDAFILGEGHFIPGFEEAIIGMRAGNEKEKISLNIPENHHLKNIAGQKIELKVKILSVQKVEFPELDDQFAKNLGNFDDLSGLKKNINEGLNFEKKQAESQKVRNEILEKINKEIICEIPEVLIEQEQNRMLEEFRHNVSENLKISFNDYLNQVKKTEKEIKDSFLDEAPKRVKNFLILREVGEKENIEVSEKEIEDEVNKMLKNYPSGEKAGGKIDPEKLKLYTENVIRNEKIFQLLESFINTSEGKM